MTKIACVLVQPDAPLLLRPWLLYHGYLFGFDAIHVEVSGTPSEPVTAELAEFAALGVTVTPGDAAEPAATALERRLLALRSAGYDIAVPLDCEEFLGFNGSEGPCCRRAPILAELARIVAEGVTGMADYGLESEPKFFDLFRYVENRKTFTRLDGDPAVPAPVVPSELMCIRMPRRTEAGVYAGFAGHTPPLLRFRGLTRLLEAVMDCRTTRIAWEAGRAAGLPEGAVELDLDSLAYCDIDYYQANTDLNIPRRFHHFVFHGYFEGRWSNLSQAAREAAAARLAYLRTRRPDGVSGFRGMALAMERAGQRDLFDGTLEPAFDQFGHTYVLLREYALGAMFREAFPVAVERWDRLREAFPDEIDGYVHGAESAMLSARSDHADQIAADGLARFPDHIGIQIVGADLATERGDWQRSKALWDDLLLRHPHDHRIREKAGAASFRNRLLQFEGELPGALDIMDGPVSMEITPGEADRAAQILGLADATALRGFFMKFENLGSNCEFGLVQRRHGAEPIGMLRWNSIDRHVLADGLEAGFAGIDEPDNLLMVPHGREYALRDLRYGTVMHTFITINSADPEKLLAQQVRRLTYLRNKLIGDLELGEKIFVFLDGEPYDAEAVTRLHRAIRKYGDTTLLYVRIADTPGQIGRVETGGEGLLLGYIERLGRLDGMWNITFDAWFSICRTAWVLAGGLINMDS